MSQRFILVTIFALLAPEIYGQLIPLTHPDARDVGRLPLVFEPNRGQAEKDVLFRATGAHYRIDLTTRSAKIKFRDGFQVELETVGGQTPRSIRGVEQTGGLSSYFIGNDPSKWHTAIPNYRRVEYSGVYPGVNLTFYGTPEQLEYDITLAAGADPSQIQLKFQGARSVRANERGELLIGNKGRKILQRKAYAYQMIGSRKVDVEAKYVPAGRSIVRLSLSAYDKREPVVIDPILVYSTYVGETLPSPPPLDLAEAIAVDAAGNAYLAGTHWPEGNGTSYGVAFVSKVSADGSSILYTAHIGGTGMSLGQCYAVAVDSNQNAYITGYTTASDFPTKNPFQSSLKAGENAFVTKLSTDGASLVYSTYLGGSSGESGTGIAVNSAGNAYVTGETGSSDFPIVTPFQSTNHGGGDAFVTEMSADGASLVLSTFLGGSGTELSGHIALDSDQNIYVTGSTTSKNFPIALALQTILCGTQSVYVTKLASDGQTLVYSTYLCGTKTDTGTGIAVDSSGDAYVTGTTSSPNFPTKNPIQNALQFTDAFLTKISSDGSTLIYSTFLGGTALDQGNDVAVDSEGNAYVVGRTYSDNFPMANPLQGANAGFSSGFVSKISSDGSTLLYSTYLGSTGDGNDEATGIAVDSTGAAYVGGYTNGTNFPTTTGSAQSPGIPTAGFVVKITDSPSACSYSTLPMALDLGSNATTGTITVTTGPQCSWIASSNQFWISITSPDTGTGSGTISYSVAENDGVVERSAIVSVGAQIINITQDIAPCVYSLASAQQTFPSSGGTGTVNFSAGITCGGWSVSNPNSWFTVEPQSGAGNATFTFTVSPDTTNTARRGVFSVGNQQFTITQTTVGTPAVVSVTPSSGSGASQVFVLDYSDTAGAANLQQLWVYFNATLANPARGACLLNYNIPTNQINLLDDNGTTWLASNLGSATTLQNSQCSINVATATVSFGANTLTWNAQMTFKPAFAGAKKTYLHAVDASGASSGWQQLGSWTLGVTTGTPAAVSATPSSGSGANQTFALQYSDTAGAASLAQVWAYFNATLANPASSACMLYYQPSTNQINLLSDNATVWMPAILGSATTLQNSQCSLNVATATVVPSGATLTLNVTVTFKPAFAGAKNVYLHALDVSGSNSGWQQLGGWTVSSGAGTPSTVSVTPSSGSGASQTFALEYSDTAGASSFTQVWAYFNATLANPASSACMLNYDTANNQINLLSDNASVWMPATLRAATTLQNSQCSLNVATATVVPNGNTLTLNVTVTFKPAFRGAKNVYLHALDVSGSNSGWQQLGAWTVTSTSGIPSTDSVTPNSGSGNSQTFSLQYSDSAGPASLEQVWAYFNATLANPASNTCMLYYNPATNQINLLNDNATLWMPATLGSATTLQNSQCSLNMGTATVSSSGSTLTLNVMVTFKPAFAGAKNVYLHAVDVSGANGGWQQLGGWTVP